MRSKQEIRFRYLWLHFDPHCTTNFILYYIISSWIVSVIHFVIIIVVQFYPILTV